MPYPMTRPIGRAAGRRGNPARTGLSLQAEASGPRPSRDNSHGGMFSYYPYLRAALLKVSSVKQPCLRM